MHAFLLAGSMLLAVVQLLSSWLLSHRNRRGWLVSVTANIIAIPYDSFTFQYGFVLVSVLNLAVAVRGWVVWGREAHGVQH